MRTSMGMNKIIKQSFPTIIILIIHLFITIKANPVKDSKICGFSDCELDKEKFRFSKNHIYKYSYDSSFQTLFAGTDNNDPESELFISATLEIVFLSQCQGQMKLNSVHLKNRDVNITDKYEKPASADYEYDEDNDDDEAKNTSTESENIEKIIHPQSVKFGKEIDGMIVRFDFRDGIIQEICPNDDKQTWVINFVRGILSSFQNSMLRFDLDHKTTETDISGICETSYKFDGSSNTSIHVVKSKDISSCRNRNKFKSVIQTAPYEFRRSDISWWPIYNSSSTCKQIIDNYIFTYIECQESHILIPFSNGASGAIAKSVSKIKLIAEIDKNEQNTEDDEQEEIRTRTSLLYDHSFLPKPTHNELKISRDFLKQMCLLGFPNIQREFPDYFLKFIGATKQLSTHSLRQLLARSAGICFQGRKHVLESLPFIGSPASVAIMKDFIIGNDKSQKIDEATKEVWMNSIFYLPHPEDETLQIMFDLIQHYEVEQNPIFLLIPSAVVHTFCMQKNCINNESAANIVKYLEDKVVELLKSDVKVRKVFEKLIVTLKGIGNIGILSRNFEMILRDILIDEDKSEEVKLQVIQTFRRTNCENSREFFMDIYRNMTLSVDIRISSYLQVIKCPSYLTIQTIKRFLLDEKVNQVGSYVWSHLTNLGKTSSPQKIQLQGLLTEDKLSDKFNLNFQKFSKNYEYSLFFDEYNFGITGESDVIYGIESYMPRSISFNGTINLFGNSINPFEFNIRFQGMENYIESIFGLSGALNFNRLLNKFGFVYEKIKKLFNFENDIIDSVLRSKRAASTSENLIESFPFEKNYDFNSPEGYFEYKIYGNDLSFHYFQGFDELSNTIKKFVPIEKVKNIFSRREEIFIQSGTLIDASYTVPTSTGFPLVLSGFGAYSLDMRYYGSINDKKDWESYLLDFHGKVNPSLSMEFNVKLLIDLIHASSDVKVKSNIFSNYGIETDLNIEGIKKASLKVKLPQDRNDIFSVRSQLIGNIEGQEMLLRGIPHRYMNSTCTWPSIDDMLGLKLCIDYSVPDVSDASNVYPSLVLSGPIVFDIHLDKADLSAKVFNFEYQWNNKGNISFGSMNFLTPNSKIPRELSATLRIDDEYHNVTMMFKNGQKTQTAHGLIRSTPNAKMMDLSYSVNEKNYFSLVLSSSKKRLSPSKSSINPRFMLVINDQKVAGMTGLIKTIEKNNVTQHDVDLRFETKKMQSLAIGHIIKTETSLTTKMQYTYKFSGKQPETIEVDTELANRSQRMRGRTEYHGSLKFVSSAYSHYNFASDCSLLSSQGHIEAKFGVNNAPDFIDPSYNFQTKLTLAKNSDDSKNSRTMFSVEVTRPKSNIDLKFYVKHDEHYKNGTEHNVIMLLRYSTNKEVIGTASVLIPRGSLFGIDTRFTLSIPEMNSCSAAVKIKERVKKDYIVDVNGEWFTGENIKFVGLYQDRTSSIKRYHRLKSVISSNSFDEITSVVKYSRDPREFKVKINTEYKKKTYTFSIQSLEENPKIFILQTELNWAEASYSLNTNLSLQGNGLLKAEVHLDRIRDIHLETWGIAKRFSNNFGLEFKWDANRNPSQKFILNYEFDQIKAKVYSGNILVSYPERTLNGKIYLSNESPYLGSLKFSWSADEAIEIAYSIGSDFQSHTKLWAEFKFDTPFNGWKSNRLNGSFYQKENLLMLSAYMNWAEKQNLSYDLLIDYLLNERELSAELKTNVQSTVADIPLIHAHLKHLQKHDEVYSVILFKHKNLVSTDFRIFSLNSNWKHFQNIHHRNITGSVTFSSPFEGYNTGAFITKFSVTKNRQLYGIIDVDIDDRLYLFAIEGYMRTIFDNMISFNLTTPLKNFPYLLGKFGIVESSRYLIADLESLNRSLGIEMLYDFISINNFNLKFYIATPQASFQRVLAIGAIKEHMIHFEGAWNKISLGFKGVWYQKSYKDFEYSYKVFTPLTHFEENGLVTKIKVTDIQNYDVESTFKLGKYKVGIKACGEPKTQLINQLGIQKASYIRENVYLDDDIKSDEISEDKKLDIDSFDEFYSTTGHFELHTIFWNSFEGNYEVQQVGETYHGFAKVSLPYGEITLRNKFETDQNSSYSNKLQIATPIKNFKSIVSNFKMKLVSAKEFTTKFDIGTVEGKKLKSYGFKMSYLLPLHETTTVHDVTLVVLHPSINTSRINIEARVETLKGSICSFRLVIDGLDTYLMISGAVNKTTPNKDFDISFNLHLKSPVIKFYLFESFLSRKVIENRNKIAGHFNLQKENEENNFEAALEWNHDQKDIIDGNLMVKTSLFPIRNFNTKIFITEHQNPEFNLQILYGDHLNNLEMVKFNIIRQENVFEGELTTPLKEYSNARFNGVLQEKSQPGNFIVKGHIFIKLLPHAFEGELTLLKNLPIHVDLVFKDQEDVIALLDYNLEFDDLKRSIKLKATKDSDFISFQSELYVQYLMDWAYNIKILSSEANLNQIMLSTTLTPLSNAEYEASFEMITPWSESFIDRVNISSGLKMTANDGDFKLSYEISKINGNGGCYWKWLQKSQKQDYQLKIFTQRKTKQEHFTTEIIYRNSSKTATDFLFLVSVENLWKISSHALFNIRNVENMTLKYELSLPEPIEGNHKILANYKGNHFPPKISPDSFIDVDFSYENEMTTTDLKTMGTLKDFKNVDNEIMFKWGDKTSPKILQSNFSLQTLDQNSNCLWELSTPYYENEKTFNLKGNFIPKDEFKVIHATVHSPESQQIIIGDMAFADITNMKGYINCSLPVFNVSWFDVNFDFDAQDQESGKFIKATWPENYALLDSKSTFINQNDHREWKGTVKTELPLYSKHIVQIIYGLKEKSQITTGDASVDYNSKNIINSHYTSKTEIYDEDESKNVINLTIENEFTPIGMHYTHQRKNDQMKTSKVNTRHLELFDLRKDNRFNITGEFTVEVSDGKEDYKLTAIHPNRTIVLTSSYNQNKSNTLHSSKLELASNIWFGYNIELLNRTVASVENQEVNLELFYPTRNVWLKCFYLLKSDQFLGDLTVQLKKTLASETEQDDEVVDEDSDNARDTELKTIQGNIQWNDLEALSKTKDHHKFTIGLKHPSFEKDVTLSGFLLRDASEKARIDLEYDYSIDGSHLAKFSAEIANLTSFVGYKNYSISVLGSHEASEFDLNFSGFLGLKPNKYKIEASGLYKRAYLPEQEMELLAYADINNKKIKVYRSTPNKLIDVYATTSLNFPIYSIDTIYVDSPDYESAGTLVLNIIDRFIDGNLNFTFDASQNLQIRGDIPDTRSAFFNIWRNYDDVRVNDISYFLMMNHSRLISSKLIWRPSLRKEFKDSIKTFMTSRYSSIAHEIDYWIRILYSETKDTVKGVMDESKTFTQDFLEDLSSIKDIDKDLSSFRTFLNNSYYADDFYIQSFINFTLTVLDELAITDHLQTIPRIFKEMWEVLGESSLAFKNSILWILDTIKVSYKESIEMFNQLLQGNSLDHLTKFLEILIEKYDRFVKDLHVTFMNYIESMWDNLVYTVSVYWNRILQNIEPQIIRSIHYIESVVWGISTEVFDFMYNRTNELIESPYFSKVSNITHDLDVLYQDLQHNDIFVNFRKYSGVMWQFLKEKFLSMVPFGKEIKEIFADVSLELKELQKVEPLKETVQRYEDIIAKISWLMNEFQLEKRINLLIDVLKKKLNRITQNALQTDDVYREAKTKFILDPDMGIIEWEQKLPMAWHAFNETPQFEEIPEYKLLTGVQSFLFNKRNTSIFNIYYGLKPLSEPQNFLPPFNSYALLVGSQHIITFDQINLNLNTAESNEDSRTVTILNSDCSHLLAHDFVSNKFTLILKSATSTDGSLAKKSFVIYSGSEKIEIELGDPLGAIHIGENLTSVLPTSIGDLMIIREIHIITVSSRKGFIVRCNLEFDLCTIELSGWFFGKVAGILGTMNNEHFDDMMKSDNVIAEREQEFIESWQTDSCVASELSSTDDKFNVNSSVSCEIMFKMKTSYFASCFSIIDSLPFYQMCLSLNQQPRYQLTNEEAEKAACTSGIAYIEACSYANVPLRVPDTCINCKLPNGSRIPEGTFTEIKGDQVIPAVDVVFLLDAKKCNTDNTKRKLLSTLAMSLTREFKLSSIDHHRFSVVIFGGSEEFQQPRSITSNGNVFTTADRISTYFDHVNEGNGTADVLTAIAFASKLIFRPTAVKTFVLSLCGKCEYNLLKFDFKSVSQLLRENDISLHILSDNPFNSKKVIGIDQLYAYTGKDLSKITGDENLRRNALSSESPLRQCSSLAFETDGSIFSLKKSNKKTENDMRINLFAQRISLGSRVKSCHLCECEGYNSGTAYLTCMSCEDQSSIHSDYDIEVEADIGDFYDDDI